MMVRTNDDDQTGSSNGNGLGNWVRASEAHPSANIQSDYPLEWLNYANIPSGNKIARIHVRLSKHPLRQKVPSAQQLVRVMM